VSLGYLNGSVNSIHTFTSEVRCCLTGILRICQRNVWYRELQYYKHKRHCWHTLHWGQFDCMCNFQQISTCNRSSCGTVLHCVPCKATSSIYSTYRCHCSSLPQIYSHQTVLTWNLWTARFGMWCSAGVRVPHADTRCCWSEMAPYLIAAWLGLQQHVAAMMRHLTSGVNGLVPAWELMGDTSSTCFDTLNCLLYYC